MKKVLVITNRFKDEELFITEKVCKHLKDAGVEVIQAVVDRKVKTLNDALLGDVECAIILGGDGTIMQFANQLSLTDIPILGINMGHVGYLAEVDSNHVEDALARLVSGNYKVQRRMMITGTVRKKGKVIFEDTAVNDVVITRNGRLQVINFNIYVNGNLLKNYSADGVILSTPTGSTAYNLSAGGPIVDPGAEILIVTPISPHTLMNRSLVLNATDNVEIEVLPTHEEEEYEEIMEVDFDGKENGKLVPGDRVGVTGADSHVKMICLNEVSFMETLHAKMKES
ncbi:MAG: NAD(+)/NADH kinase [Lachnospiraceae bacterium]|nr:NAD(+)/NADH kinase [Lachnospiraceae bacterium]